MKMTLKDNGPAYDPHAGHKMSNIQGSHDRHASPTSPRSAAR
jgi:hypothetical protein